MNNTPPIDNMSFSYLKIGYRLYRMLGYLVIIIAFLLIGLRLFASYFSPSEAQLIEWVKKHSSYALNIQSAQFDFVGWNPEIKLRDVEVFTEDNQLALNIENVNIVFNVYAFLFKKIELDSLVLEGMQIGVEYLQDGSIAISSLSTLKWSPQQSLSSQVSVKHLLIKESDIHLLLNEKKSLPLAQIELQMDANSRFRVKGRATVVSDRPSIVHFSLDYPVFSKQKAQFYCDWENGDWSLLAALLEEKLPPLPNVDTFDLKMGLSIDAKGKKKFVGELEFLKDNVKKGEGWLSAQNEDEHWKAELQWHEENNPTPYEFFLKTYSCAEKECIDVQTWNLDIENIKQQLKKFDLMPSAITKLNNYEINGNIDYLSLKCEKNEFNVLPVEAELAFSNVSIQGDVKLKNVQGALHYQNGKTNVLIQGAPTVQYSKWFTQPLKAEDLKLWLTYSPFEETTVQGVLSSATINNTPLFGSFLLSFNNHAIKNMEFLFESKESTVKNVLQVLPKNKMDSTLVAWLEQALVSGKIQQSTCLFKGAPKDFPFDNHNGIFEANIKLNNVTLDYDKNRWPPISQLEANVLFKNRKMEVDAKRGLLSDGALLPTKAIISDLFLPVPLLEINAKLSNQLNKGASIIESSPLKESLGKFLSALNFDGEMDLNLGLNIPLTTKTNAPIHVKGLLSMKDAMVTVPSLELDAKHLNGAISFTENGITANKLKGMLFDDVAYFDIATHQYENQSECIIQANGHLKYDNLKKWLPNASYDFIKGETDYASKISFFSDIEKHPIHFEMTSSLAGIEINAPAPFGKTLLTEKNPSLFIDLVPNQSAHIKIEYGENVSLALSMHQSHEKWKFKGGNLNFGNTLAAKSREDGILLIDGNLEEVNAQEWKTMLTGEEEHKLSFEPLIALNIDKLSLFGEVFSKTNIEAEWDKVASLWNFNFDGPSIKGHITLPQGEDQRDIVIDLQKLVLTLQKKETNWLEDQNVLKRPIECKIKKLKIDKKSLTQFKARIEPSWKGYYFPHIETKLKGTEITLSGQWDAFGHSKQVVAEGKLTTKNSSDTFKAIGIAGTVHQAKGSVDFALEWQGTPMAIDYPTLSGKASFQLNNGYVQGVNPGIGRVLNLLSLDTVQRRLNFDFNDVTKSGFAFDEFSGKFQFGKGKVSTNKISLRGPSANIQGYGQADLEIQNLDAELIVMPNVTGSLPVAAAIAAGNPAVGAAVWLVDKMVGKKLQEIHRYRYRLVGTWDAPKLEEISFVPIRRG